MVQIFKKHPVRLFAFLIIVLGAGLRLYQLGSIPIGLYWDEIAMLVDVKAILATGNDMHGNSIWQTLFLSYGDYKLPVYIWLATLSGAIFGVSEFSLRFPSFIAGVSTIIIAGLLAQAFLETNITTILPKKKSQLYILGIRIDQLLVLATMVVVSISPWSFMFSRTGFEGHVGQLLLGLSIWLTFKAQQNWQWLWLATLVGILSVYTYFSIRFVWPVTYLLTVLHIIGWPNFSIKKFDFSAITISWKHTLIIMGTLVLFFIGLIPMSRGPYYEQSNAYRLSTNSILKNDEQVLKSNIYRELAGNSSLDRVIFHRQFLTFQELAKNYSDHVNLKTLFIYGDGNLRHSTTKHGLFLLIFLPNFLLGLGWWWNKDWRSASVLIIWWLVALLPASVPEETPHALRSLNALIPVSILIGGGVVAMMSYLTQNSNYVKKIILSAWFLSIFVTSVEFFYYYFVIYPKDSSFAWQDGFKDLAQTAYTVREQNDYKILVTTFDERFFLWMMMYGPYSGQEFQTWEKDGSQFKNFDEVLSNEKDFDLVLTNMINKTILIGTPQVVENFVKNYQLHILETKTVQNSQQTYIVVLVEKSILD